MKNAPLYTPVALLPAAPKHDRGTARQLKRKDAAASAAWWAARAAWREAHDPTPVRRPRAVHRLAGDWS
jgi:hypothetical protein